MKVKTYKCKESKTRRRVLEGTVFVCQHYVEWWLEIDNIRLTDEEKVQIEEDAYDRARECIYEGYHSGELCTCLVRGQKEYEFFGWWSIESKD